MANKYTLDFCIKKVYNNKKRSISDPKFFFGKLAGMVDLGPWDPHLIIIAVHHLGLGAFINSHGGHLAVSPLRNPSSLISFRALFLSLRSSFWVLGPNGTLLDFIDIIYDNSIQSSFVTATLSHSLRTGSFATAHETQYSESLSSLNKESPQF